MKTQGSKTQITKESTIRDIVRDEIQKSIGRQKHMVPNESIFGGNRYKTKQKLMLDLIKPIMIKDTLGQGIASQMIKSILKKL